MLIEVMIETSFGIVNNFFFFCLDKLNAAPDARETHCPPTSETTTWGPVSQY